MAVGGSGLRPRRRRRRRDRRARATPRRPVPCCRDRSRPPAGAAADRRRGVPAGGAVAASWRALKRVNLHCSHAVARGDRVAPLLASCAHARGRLHSRARGSQTPAAARQAVRHRASRLHSQSIKSKNRGRVSMASVLRHVARVGRPAAAAVLAGVALDSSTAATRPQCMRVEEVRIPASSRCLQRHRWQRCAPTVSSARRSMLLAATARRRFRPRRTRSSTSRTCSSGRSARRSGAGRRCAWSARSRSSTAAAR